MSDLKRTPLYPAYEKHGAKTIPFGGWDMPVQFTGIQKEHDAVRTQAGLFDVSHMGEIWITGEGAESFLQSLTTNDIHQLEDGKAQYSILCYPDGGTVDDLLVYRLTKEHFMLVVNAGNRSKVLEWLEKHLREQVKMQDVSDETALLAIQGPNAESVLQELTKVDLSLLKPFHFVTDAEVGDTQAIISRTGYTGEDGFELYFPQQDAVSIWEQLLEHGKGHGLVPVGLGARDTLRFEARLPLYGQELGPDITPIEAGLGFAVRPEKGDFIGSEVLAVQKKQGPPRKLVGVEMIDRGIPRSGYPVYKGEQQIGQVTTGTQSPTLKRNVGLALIQAEYAIVDQEVEVEIRGKRLRAQVVKTPFYKKQARAEQIQKSSIAGEENKQ